jgi:hypothetical protein
MPECRQTEAERALRPRGAPVGQPELLDPAGECLPQERLGLGGPTLVDPDRAEGQERA